MSRGDQLTAFRKEVNVDTIKPGADLYQRFHAGETLHVQSPLSDKRFYVKPEFVFGALLGYTILDEQTMKPVPGYSRKQMVQQELRLWVNSLVEIVERNKDEGA